MEKKKREKRKEKREKRTETIDTNHKQSPPLFLPSLLLLLSLFLSFSLSLSLFSLLSPLQASVHLCLYLFLGVCHTNSSALNQSLGQRYAALFWVGSMMNSLHVLFPGVFCGSLGASTELSILFNVPFFLFPVWYGLKTFSQPPATSFYRASPATALDGICLIFYLFLPFLAFLRLFAAMESPYPHAIWWRESVEPILTNAHKFPLLQTIVNVFWGIPLSWYLAFCHKNGAKNRNYWVADAAAFAAGAAVQAQACFIGSAMMEEALVPTPGFKPIPSEGLGGNLFWVVNVSLIAFPLLSLFRWCYLVEQPLPQKEM